MARKLNNLFRARYLSVKEALHDWRQLSQEASKEPMHVKELVILGAVSEERKEK